MCLARTEFQRFCLPPERVVTAFSWQSASPRFTAPSLSLSAIVCGRAARAHIFGRERKRGRGEARRDGISRQRCGHPSEFAGRPVGALSFPLQSLSLPLQSDGPQSTLLARRTPWRGAHEQARRMRRTHGLGEERMSKRAACAARMVCATAPLTHVRASCQASVDDPSAYEGLYDLKRETQLRWFRHRVFVAHMRASMSANAPLDECMRSLRDEMQALPITSASKSVSHVSL